MLNANENTSNTLLILCMDKEAKTCLKSLHLKFMVIFYNTVLWLACCIFTRIEYFCVHTTETVIETNELTAWQWNIHMA